MTPEEALGTVMAEQGYLVLHGHFPHEIGAVVRDAFLAGWYSQPVVITGPATSEEFNRQDRRLRELLGQQPEPFTEVSFLYRVSTD